MQGMSGNICSKAKHYIQLQTNKVDLSNDNNKLFYTDNITLLQYGHLSSPKTGHTTGGSGRHGAGRTAMRGDAGQNKVPTFRWPWKPTAPLALQRTVNNFSERIFANTNTGNPMLTVEGTKHSVDPRFITDLSAIYHRDCERSSSLAIDQCNDAYGLCKPFFMQGMSGNPAIPEHVLYK